MVAFLAPGPMKAVEQLSTPCLPATPPSPSPPISLGLGEAFAERAEDDQGAAGLLHAFVGQVNTMPGPATRLNLPKRSTTAFSHSNTICTDEATNQSATTTAIKAAIPHAANTEERHRQHRRKSNQKQDDGKHRDPVARRATTPRIEAVVHMAGKRRRVDRHRPVRVASVSLNASHRIPPIEKSLEPSSPAVSA